LKTGGEVVTGGEDALGSFLSTLVFNQHTTFVCILFLLFYCQTTIRNSFSFKVILTTTRNDMIHVLDFQPNKERTIS
jgi:hypothetical protein